MDRKRVRSTYEDLRAGAGVLRMAGVLPAVYAALMVASAVACVCGNVVHLLLLLLHKELRPESLGFTLSSSLSDLALGLTVIPFGALNSVRGPAAGPSSAGAVCQSAGFLLVLLQTSSVHSLLWATVEKFSEICFALSWRRVWTSGRSRTLVVLVWSFSSLGATLPLLGFGSYTYSATRFLCCPSFTPEGRSFILLWALMGVATPIVAMGGLYASIIYVASKQARRGTFMCNEQHCFYVPANAYLRSSIVMVTTSGQLQLSCDWSSDDHLCVTPVCDLCVCAASLLVCWLPYLSVGVYESLGGVSPPEASSSLSSWLVVTSAALNPWITCLTQV